MSDFVAPAVNLPLEQLGTLRERLNAVYGYLKQITAIKEKKHGLKRIGSGSEVKAEGGDFRPWEKILPDLDGVTRITLLSALNNLLFGLAFTARESKFRVARAAALFKGQ